MPSSGEPKIRFEITQSKPEDEPQRLAIQLAELLTKACASQVDCDSFRSAAQAERAKAKSMQNVIHQLKGRTREDAKAQKENRPLPRRSRMDPLGEYDLGICLQELECLKRRAQELQNESDAHGSEAQQARTDVEKLRRKIHEANAKLKQQGRK